MNLNLIRYIPPMLFKEKHQGLLAGSFLFLVTFLVYIPAIRAGFVWDDDDFLWDNPLVKLPDGLYRFWFTTIWRDYFPLTSTTIWLEWRLFGAENPWGYHFNNVLLHATSSLLLWRLLARLEIPGAWFAALIFAIHPVNVESVAWITQRKNTLPMMFALLSALLYLKSGGTGEGNGLAPATPAWRSPHYWLALFCFLLALLSKTSVVMLPVALLVLTWWRSGTLCLRDFYRTIPFFVTAVVLSLVTIWFQYNRAIMGEIVRDDSLLSRTVIAGWAVWFYLYKALLPLNLSFVYPRWEANMANPLVYLPLLALAAVTVFLWFRRAQPWARAALAALLIDTAMLFPVLGFFDIYFMRYSLVADHYQYFSIPAIVAPVAALAVMAARHMEKPVVSGSLAAVALFCLALLTWRQAGHYHDAETLWRATLERNPACWIGHYNLGNIHAADGRPGEAIASYRKALEQEPDHPGILDNLGLALNETGEHGEAIAVLQRVVELRPGAAEPHVNLGSVLYTARQVDEAIAHYRKALEFDPDAVRAHNNLGVALMEKGGVDEAVFHYQRVLRIQPDHADAHYNLGTALLDQNRLDEAIAHYEKVLEIQPDHYLVQNSLGAALLQAGRWREAAFHFEKSVAVRPGDLPPLNNLAWVLAASPDPSARNGARAVEFAERAQGLTDGRNPTILHTLAAAYAEAGRFEEAVKAARLALEIASAQGNASLAGRIRAELELYTAGFPFHNDPKPGAEEAPAPRER